MSEKTLAAPQAPVTLATFQQRVAPWVVACFGPQAALDGEERNHRFLEESIELAQACGATAEQVKAMVDYVYSRPAGKVEQEAGGVLVTLAALCEARKVDIHAAAETELSAIWQKVDAIRQKWQVKPAHIRAG
ncbi:hypothetical protein [Rugamonas sp.]|uniref:hypothetical protein n=1 Tax=Rugamonas sp. TaxID=1926287 RepID=UPI0025EEDEC8|nr:hypothetical protein [Rugamonas sp.]